MSRKGSLVVILLVFAALSLITVIYIPDSVRQSVGDFFNSLTGTLFLIIIVILVVIFFTSVIVEARQ